MANERTPSPITVRNPLTFAGAMKPSAFINLSNMKTDIKKSIDAVQKALAVRHNTSRVHIMSVESHFVLKEIPSDHSGTSANSAVYLTARGSGSACIGGTIHEIEWIEDEETNSSYLTSDHDTLIPCGFPQDEGGGGGSGTDDDDVSPGEVVGGILGGLFGIITVTHGIHGTPGHPGR